MEVPVHWRLKKQRYKLEGNICTHCESPHFPPRDVCPDCGGDNPKKSDDNANIGRLHKAAIDTFVK